MAKRDDSDASIFSALQYYVAGNISDEVKKILDKSGAKCHEYLNEQLVKVAITDWTEDEGEYSQISDIYDIPVVSCDWVVLSKKCGKLLPTKPFPPKLTSSALFKNKLFCASHFEKTELDSLWAMITFNGGTTRRLLNSEITHLICTSTSGRKYSQSHNLPNVRVVTPDWVTDCIKASKLLDEAEYHPKLLISSPALRKQLLSPSVSGPSDLKWKSVSLNSSTKKSTAFQTPVPSRSTGHAQSTPVTSFVSGSPHVPSYANAPSTRFEHPRPLHEMPSGFPGFQQSHTPAMIGSSQPPGHVRRPITAQFPEPGSYLPHPGSYAMPHGNPMTGLGSDQMPPAMHHQVGRPMNRPYLKNTPPPAAGDGMVYAPTPPSGPGEGRSYGPTPPPGDGRGYAPIHYTGAGSRHSPISPSMMGVRHPVPMMSRTMQRSSPINNRKTPPMMNLGQMTEVPYPSQASLPEETPIIRMTNMAAFPMGSEIISTTQRKSPVSSTRGTPPKSQQQQQHYAAAASPAYHQQSKSPVNMQAATPNVSVIKPVKPPLPEDSVPAVPASTSTPAERSPAAAVGGTGAEGTAADVYYGYDSNESVPVDMCLAGCILYMGEYLKNDPCDDWIKVIELNGGTVDPSYSNRVTHVLVETQSSDVCRLALNDGKRVVTAHWLNDVIGQQKMEPPWRAHHLPHPHAPDRQLCADQVIGVSGFNKEERKILLVLVRMIGASFTKYLARTNTVLVCKALEGEKVKKAKEWGVPCVNVQWLSEVVLGNLRAIKLPIDNKYKVFGRPDDFAIDQHMAAAVMAGWRVALKIPKDCCRKFKPSTKSADSAWESKRKADGELFLNPTKRMRLQEIQHTKSNLPVGQKPIILLTGFTPSEKTKYSEMIVSLGGVLSTSISQCTHLIADKVLRTPNFLLAINYCSYISSSEWITESSKSGHFVDERVFTLQNSEAGSMWKILEALERRATHGKPFNGLTFHITPGVPLSTHLPRKFLVSLITAAGGVIQTPAEKRWSAKEILATQKTSNNNKPTYIVVSCKDDIHICVDLLHNKQDIYSVEFILSGVMNQQTAYEAVLCTIENE